MYDSENKEKMHLFAYAHALKIDNTVLVTFKATFCY